jgi:hypothetical protein
MAQRSAATFFHRYDAGRDPAELLAPENHHSTPWGSPDRGACDKCRGTGRTHYECLSCIEEGSTNGCPACHGRIRWEDVCPACEGAGMISRTMRPGVSVFPSLRGLYRYLVERDADLDGSLFVELTGDPSGERDLDADEGALLVIPTEIVATHPVEPGYVEALRERIARQR